MSISDANSLKSESIFYPVLADVSMYYMS